MLEIARRRIAGVWRTGPVEEGDSQSGAVRRLTVDVTAADLAEGPITIYTPAAGEVVGPVYLYDVVFCDPNIAITIGRDEQVPGDADYPALAGWDSDLSKDGAAIGLQGNREQTPLTTGPVTAGFTDGTFDKFHSTAWDNATPYAQFDTIVSAGHIWFADPGGTSGAVKPDFAGNIGGTVVDNDITWNDFGPATAGSATVSFDVCTPVAL